LSPHFQLRHLQKHDPLNGLDWRGTWVVLCGVVHGRASSLSSAFSLSSYLSMLQRVYLRRAEADSSLACRELSPPPSALLSTSSRRGCVDFLAFFLACLLSNIVLTCICAGFPSSSEPSLPLLPTPIPSSTSSSCRFSFRSPFPHPSDHERLRLYLYWQHHLPLLQDRGYELDVQGMDTGVDPSQSEHDHCFVRFRLLLLPLSLTERD
jgi:hypothetical protein